MTWHTESGDRYLKGAESRLFRAALRSTLEAIEDDEHDFYQTLLSGQSVASLYQLFLYVAVHLLRPTDNLPSLNAWTEGAVGVVFRQLRTEVQIERDCEAELGERSHHWRNMITAAMQEIEPAEEASLAENDDPEYTLSEEDQYGIRMEILEERILWDADWELAADLLSDEVKHSLGIPQDYFDWSITSDLTTSDTIKALGDLCGFHRGDYEGVDVPF